MQGRLKSKIPLGFTGVAIGDVDGDGHLEGVGLSNTRDGGDNGRQEVRCVDLATGSEEWTRPVARAYLDATSPIAADLNSDGRPEAIVGTGNPAAYARLPGSEPWGDMYVFDGAGEIMLQATLPGRPVNMAFGDIDDDGLAELAVVVNGTPGWLALYRTQAPAHRKDWPTAFGSASRAGAMCPGN